MGFEHQTGIAGGSVTIPDLKLRVYISETFNLYNPTTKNFDHTLCYDGMAKYNSGANPSGCSTNSFNMNKLDTFDFALNTVGFVKENAPLTNINAVEAALILDSSQITDGEEIKLPTNMQWEQVVGLVINNKANWSAAGKTSNEQDPTLVHGDQTTKDVNCIFRGHVSTDGPAKEADADENGYTGITSSDIGDRRTLVVANNISVRNYSDDAAVKVNDPAVASNYAAVIWDFSGNVAEWTRELLVANATTGYSSAGGVVGGDRFLDGKSEWNEFANVIKTESEPNFLMPTWLEPRLSSNLRLDHENNYFGQYNDGNSDTGVICSSSYIDAGPAIDFSYGTGNDSATSHNGGVAALYRGGSYEKLGYDKYGVNLLSVAFSPAYRAPFIGFRAASSTNTGTKGVVESQ